MLEKSKEKCTAEEIIQVLPRVLKYRFGSPPQSLVESIRSMSDVDLLIHLTFIAHSAESFQDFMNEIPPKDAGQCGKDLLSAHPDWVESMFTQIVRMELTWDDQEMKENIHLLEDILAANSRTKRLERNFAALARAIMIERFGFPKDIPQFRNLRQAIDMLNKHSSTKSD